MEVWKLAILLIHTVPCSVQSKRFFLKLILYNNHVLDLIVFFTNSNTILNVHGCLNPQSTYI